MNKTDIKYLLALIFCGVWIVALIISKCEIIDAPFGFVGGCDTYGINWNSFLAPTGLIVVFAFPVSFLYFVFRLFVSLKKLIKSC